MSSDWPSGVSNICFEWSARYKCLLRKSMLRKNLCNIFWNMSTRKTIKKYRRQTIWHSCNTVVNVTNILRAAFLPIFLSQESIKPNLIAKTVAYEAYALKKLHVKFWWNWHLETPAKLRHITLLVSLVCTHWNYHHNDRQRARLHWLCKRETIFLYPYIKESQFVYSCHCQGDFRCRNKCLPF